MNKMIGKITLTLFIFAFILIGTTTVIKAEEQSFSLDKTTLSVKLNSEGYLNYKNKPSGETIIWESTNPSVATVDNGIVQGKSIGKTMITAKVAEQIASCEVTVVYGDLKIEGNDDSASSSINLILEEHPSENLKAIVQDGNYEKVDNAKVTWKSDDTSIVTVDDTGTITAVSVGKTNITASIAGVTKTKEVNVIAAPKFTDFSNAKYELLFDVDTDLKISGIEPKDDNDYYYIITSSNKKPNVLFDKDGSIDTDTSKEVNYLNVNSKEKYIYTRNIDGYVELNQDLYLWVIQDIKLENIYYDSEGNYISHSAKFVAEGKKLTRPSLPQLNLILKSFTVGNWEGESTTDICTYINFIFPSATKNRKFKIKIGKITDNSILQKIQAGDYSGITELLEYAKKNNAIYTEDLTTTSENYYRSDKALFDGKKLLQNKAYYYIYVQFDDENGKYYPIEGVTLGQAWFSTTNEKNWDLFAYTESNFKWNNLSSTYTDNTVAKEKLPNTGMMMTIAISIAILLVATITFKVKKDKYKEI